MLGIVSTFPSIFCFQLCSIAPQSNRRSNLQPRKLAPASTFEAALQILGKSTILISLNSYRWYFHVQFMSLSRVLCPPPIVYSSSSYCVFQIPRATHEWPTANRSSRQSHSCQRLALMYAHDSRCFTLATRLAYMWQEMRINDRGSKLGMHPVWQTTTAKTTLMPITIVAYLRHLLSDWSRH